MRPFFYLLIILLSCPALAQKNWLFDVEAIKLHLSQQQIDEHMQKKEPIPSIYIASILKPRPIFEICPDPNAINIFPRYEVLLIAEDKKHGPNGPEPHPALRMLMMKIEDPKENGKTPYPTGGVPPEGAIVTLKQESMDEMFSYVSPLVELRYATGMQAPGAVNVIPEGGTGPYVESSQVNWLKRADLKLKLSPHFHFLGDVVIQETLGPADPKKAKIADDLENMKFHTNQVNVNVGTEAHVSSRVSLRSGLTYEDSLTGKSAGVLSGVDVRVGTGTRLLIYSSYKAAIVSEAPNFFMANPSSGNQGGAAGVRIELFNGIQIKGAVNGLGSSQPSVEGGVVIPMDISPKK